MAKFRGSDKPKIPELHDHVRRVIAPDWYDLGVQLLDDEQAEKLDVIQSDHHGDSEKCCTAMFKHWLKVDKNASWDKLITALKHISHVTLADKIKAMTSKVLSVDIKMEDTAGVVRLGMPYDQTPESKDLNRFLTDYCKHWRATGLQLGLKSSVLDLVEADHHTQRERFRMTLERWLQLNVGATWANLELAITNANRESLGFQPLTTLPTNQSVMQSDDNQPRQDDESSPVEHTNEKQKVKRKRKKSSDPESDLDDEESLASTSKLKSKRKASQQDVKLSDQTSLLEREPQMFELTEIVIPKIKAEWERLAFCMRYTSQEVKGFRKDSQDSAECCRNLLDNWISTDHGPKPKTYKTLLKSIKKIKSLAATSKTVEIELIEALQDEDE